MRRIEQKNEKNWSPRTQGLPRLAASLDRIYKKVKAEADKIGIPMVEKEFHCKGEFKGLHKGRPNEEDLRAAAAFAKSLK